MEKLSQHQDEQIQPALFINIWNGKSGTNWYYDLVNLDGEKWTMGGPGNKNKITNMATQFHEFSGIPIYMEGERYDGLERKVNVPCNAK